MSDSRFKLWVASTRDRFDYTEGPFPNREAAKAPAEEVSMTPLEWSQEGTGSAQTADTHGWTFRVYPVDESGSEIQP